MVKKFWSKTLNRYVTKSCVKQVKTILRGAKEIIATRGWVQGKEAVNKYRKPVDPDSSNAVRFCAYGAMSRKQTETKAGSEALDMAELLLGKVIKTGQSVDQFYATPFDAITAFNDSLNTKKEDVLAKLDSALGEVKVAEAEVKDSEKTGWPYTDLFSNT